MDSENSLKIQALRKKIGDNRLIRYLAETSSTNIVAREWAGEGAPDGALVIAESQTAGRGRKGRTWKSEPGQNLTFSLILRPGSPPDGIQSITLAGAVSVAEALEELCAVRCQIKWPNDLWVGGRKICGILSELVGGNGSPCVIMGIGVNVLQREFPTELEKVATSVLIETEKTFSRLDLAACICRRIKANLLEWEESGFAAIAEAYRKRTAFLGEWVQITGLGKDFHMEITGISDQGALCGIDENGKQISIVSGEISVRSVRHEI